MSFALEVKEEIVSHSFSQEQQKSFLSGFVKYNGELLYSSSAPKLKLTTISNRIARSLITFVKHFFNGDVQISIVQSQTLKKDKTFQITLVGNVYKFLQDINVFNENKIKVIEVPQQWLKESNLIRAYVSGIFVADGSVNAPTTTNYHLELQFKNDNEARYFVELMHKYDFQFKILERNANRYIDYIKKSLEVSDFLKFIDAGQSVMKFENERISRDMVNNINRIANIDISNEQKTIRTGEKQVQQISVIKKSGKFHLLATNAQVLADIRLENPELSYLELQDKMADKGYNISKSGISNLFRNIDKLFNSISDKEE